MDVGPISAKSPPPHPVHGLNIELGPVPAKTPPFPYALNMEPGSAKTPPLPMHYPHYGVHPHGAARSPFPFHVGMEGHGTARTSHYPIHGINMDQNRGPVHGFMDHSRPPHHTMGFMDHSRGPPVSVHGYMDPGHKPPPVHSYMDPGTPKYMDPPGTPKYLEPPGTPKPVPVHGFMDIGPPKVSLHEVHGLHGEPSHSKPPQHSVLGIPEHSKPPQHSHLGLSEPGHGRASVLGLPEPGHSKPPQHSHLGLNPEPPHSKPPQHSHLGGLSQDPIHSKPPQHSVHGPMHGLDPGHGPQKHSVHSNMDLGMDQGHQKPQHLVPMDTGPKNQHQVHSNMDQRQHPMDQKPPHIQVHSNMDQQHHSKTGHHLTNDYKMETGTHGAGKTPPQSLHSVIEGAPGGPGAAKSPGGNMDGTAGPATAKSPPATSEAGPATAKTPPTSTPSWLPILEGLPSLKTTEMGIKMPPFQPLPVGGLPVGSGHSLFDLTSPSTSSDPPTKTKRVTLSLKEKLMVINEYRLGINRNAIMEKYQMKRSTFYDIIHSRNKLVAMAQRLDTGRKRAKVYRDRRQSYEGLEEAVFQWYKGQRADGVQIRGNDIKSAADDLAKHLGYENFKASSGWVFRFRKRHGIGKNGEFDDTEEEEEIDPNLLQPFAKPAPIGPLAFFGLLGDALHDPLHDPIEPCVEIITKSPKTEEGGTEGAKNNASDEDKDAPPKQEPLEPFVEIREGESPKAPSDSNFMNDVINAHRSMPWPRMPVYPEWFDQFLPYAKEECIKTSMPEKTKKERKKYERKKKNLARQSTSNGQSSQSNQSDDCIELTRKLIYSLRDKNFIDRESMMSLYKIERLLIDNKGNKNDKKKVNNEEDE